MPENPLIENAVEQLMADFEIDRPPVPIELMLQRPKPGMWKEVNLNELSTSFISIRERYSPRMSVSRLLAKIICRSEWGIKAGLEQIEKSEEDIRALARAIIMPKAMLDELPTTSRAPMIIGMRFEVPEEDARMRLIDLGYMSGN